MKVLQILPELNSGGVERGTVDFARYLVEAGHESMVVSNGGRLVKLLTGEGSQHYEFPVHKKSIFNLLKVRKFLELIESIKPDIIHVRSRMPAWMVYLAVKKMGSAKKPTIISTFHGLYSVNKYSEIMGMGEKVIAISESVKNYIVANYPRINPAKIKVVHRGVDKNQFNRERALSSDWKKNLYSECSIPGDSKIILMPGRLSPWKGQLDFLEVIERVRKQGHDIYGLIVGEVGRKKEAYLAQLRDRAIELGVDRHISFIGHRADMFELYKVASVTLNLSTDPEPFGRTVIESLAVGTPVVAYDEGGPSEVLREMLPSNLAACGDIEQIAQKVIQNIKNAPEFVFPAKFTLEHQAQETLHLYHEAIAASY